MLIKKKNRYPNVCCEKKKRPIWGIIFYVFNFGHLFSLNVKAVKVKTHENK